MGCHFIVSHEITSNTEKNAIYRFSMGNSTQVTAEEYQESKGLTIRWPSDRRDGIFVPTGFSNFSSECRELLKIVHEKIVQIGAIVLVIKLDKERILEEGVVAPH